MLERELTAALAAAKKAEKAILEVYGTAFDVEIKEDNSPVTQADKKADDIIRGILSAEFPEDGFLTEESADTPERHQKKRIWIVDPVDGTKEFVSRNGEFTTNIALAENGQVILGIVNVPVLKKTYYAVKGQGAYCIEPDGTTHPIHVSSRKEKMRSMRSISFFRPEEKEFMERNAAYFEGEARPVGAALKFCLLAEGEGDFFIRYNGNTKEWDVAAGDILVKEAGGFVCEPSGKDFTYNRDDVYNRNGYVMGNILQDWMLLSK
ncbi:MAG: 3'(2'),5'-bisphosphate nucleotidase CysQ [Bacilli bacterium]|nr:3'(2'),5'-bisphosphate nucleotidase CysQ [Bacilli bacterium]